MMVWKLIAKLKGWKEACDVEDGALVVWHPAYGIHFTGDRAWQWAAKWRTARDRKANR